MTDLGICWLIYVVEYVVCEKLSQLILSFTRVALLAKVSGGTTRDLQALPGPLVCGFGLGICGLSWLRPDWHRLLKTTAGLAAWDHWRYHLPGGNVAQLSFQNHQALQESYYTQ